MDTFKHQHQDFRNEFTLLVCFYLQKAWCMTNIKTGLVDIDSDVNV